MESLLATCSATCRTGGGLAATDPLDLARVLNLEEQQRRQVKIRETMNYVVNRNQEVTEDMKEEDVKKTWRLLLSGPRCSKRSSSSGSGLAED